MQNVYLVPLGQQPNFEPPKNQFKIHDQVVFISTNKPYPGMLCAGTITSIETQKISKPEIPLGMEFPPEFVNQFMNQQEIIYTITVNPDLLDRVPYEKILCYQCELLSLNKIIQLQMQHHQWFHQTYNSIPRFKPTLWSKFRNFINGRKANGCSAR